MLTEEVSTLVDAAPGHVESVRENLFDHLTDAQVKHLAEILGTLRSGWRRP